MVPVAPGAPAPEETGAACAGPVQLAHVRLAHVGLVVRDLDRMQAFYAAVLGMRVSDRGVSERRGQEMVFMTGDDAVHHQLVLVSGPAGGQSRQPLDHLAFAVGSLAALRAVRDRARATGAAGQRVVDHGNAWSVYFEDPEGNAVEVLAVAPFEAAQPQGRALDLDQSDAQILAATRQSSRRPRVSRQER